jgi:hypothetical protein
MVKSEPLSDASVAAIASAIFAKGSPTVVEAYSEFGRDPRRFSSAAEVCAYAAQRRPEASGYVHLAIHYSDTSGRLVPKRVTLDPSRCNGATHRYTFEGWGIIWVYLNLAHSSATGSFVSANSQKRAEKWAATYPQQDSPATWHWPAVAAHARRLTKALRSSSS